MGEFGGYLLLILAAKVHQVLDEGMWWGFLFLRAIVIQIESTGAEGVLADVLGG